MKLKVNSTYENIDSKVDSFDPVIVNSADYKEYKRIAQKFFRKNP